MLHMPRSPGDIKIARITGNGLFAWPLRPSSDHTSFLRHAKGISGETLEETYAHGDL